MSGSGRPEDGRVGTGMAVDKFDQVNDEIGRLKSTDGHRFIHVQVQYREHVPFTHARLCWASRRFFLPQLPMHVDASRHAQSSRLCSKGLRQRSEKAKLQGRNSVDPVGVRLLLAGVRLETGIIPRLACER
jgi:hypothetical protein